MVAHTETSDKRYLQRAIGLYESLAKKMPTNSNVPNNRVYMLAQNDERLDEARRHIERALHAEPDRAAYLDTYAYVLHKQGDNAAALQSMTAAIQQHEVAGTASMAA